MSRTNLLFTSAVQNAFSRQIILSTELIGVEFFSSISEYFVGFGDCGVIALIPVVPLNLLFLPLAVSRFWRYFLLIAYPEVLHKLCISLCTDFDASSVVPSTDSSGNDVTLLN